VVVDFSMTTTVDFSGAVVVVFGEAVAVDVNIVLRCNP
jgi:hypothetical protein